MDISRVARAGLGAWFAANLYEGVVDVPALLADSRGRREPSLLGPGSPVRFFAPVGAVTLATTASTLVRHRAAEPRLVASTSACLGAAVVLSGYLIRRVNLPLIQAGEDLTDDRRRALLRTWHRTNAVRLVALGAGTGLLSELVTRRGRSA